MSYVPQPERFTLPALDTPPARAPFPVVAMVAPLGIAVAVWAMTGSPYALLFALLGPVVALAGLLDSRLHTRRGHRAAAERALDAVTRLSELVAARGQRERERLAGLAPTLEQLLGGAADWPSGGASIPVRLGSGDLPDRVELDGGTPEGASVPVRVAIGRLRASTTRLTDAPVIVDARDGIGILGPFLPARALVRSLELQLRAKRVPRGSVLMVHAERADGIPVDCGVVVRVGADGPRIERPRTLSEVACFRPEFASAAQERRVVARLDESAPPGEGGPPDRVTLSSLLEAEPPRAGLSAPIGRDAHGPVWLDLVAQGPHALIAGTTGSGKSELLVSWVVALAAMNPPSRLSFLLVDFKGGAAFAPLADLPHVLGILSDLDGRLAARAVESLRAELRRRERILAERAARSFEGLPPGVLARLVIVVDEFAVVVGEHPELQPVFADLAARGRSLGFHLVLCTQRPAGVVRDAVLANITLRVSLRVTDRADSVAVIGTDAAAALPLEPPGRALIADGAGLRLVQLAVAGSKEVATAGAHPGVGTDLVRPWCDPLPERIPLALVPADARGYAFGLVDLPSEQRQPPAVHLPESHGALLVLGATGAGKTTMLATLAARAGERAFRLPAAPADAWLVITELLAAPSRAERLLVLADDLDVLLGAFGADHRLEAIELIARLAREGPSRGLDLAASAQSMVTLHALAGSFGSRLILRLGSREEHVLAGGEGARFDAAASPGSGSWRASVVQVALADSPSSGVGADAVPVLPVVAFTSDCPTAIISGRPRELRAGLLAAGVRLVEVGQAGVKGPDELEVTSGSAPTVVLGDPDAWQAEWALLGRARRDWPVVVHAATLADHRALTRSRELPPPLGVRPGECWLVRDGVTVRAVLPGPTPRAPDRSA